MTRPFLTDPTFRASVLTKIKLGRLGQCEDLMGAIVFLAPAASARLRQHPRRIEQLITVASPPPQKLAT